MLGEAKSISMVTYVSGGAQVENALLKGIKGRKDIGVTERKGKKTGSQRWIETICMQLAAAPTSVTENKA